MLNLVHFYNLGYIYVVFLVHSINPWKVKKPGIQNKSYNKSKIHKVITSRLRRDFNEHGSNFDYNDTELKFIVHTSMQMQYI
jgi:hypothetical protein